MTRILSFLLIFCGLSAWGREPESDADLARLDAHIEQRQIYDQAKSERIEAIRNGLQNAHTVKERLIAYDRLFSEYLTFNVDSATAYINKAAALVSRVSDDNLAARVEIHRGLSMATVGHFSQAIEVLSGINTASLPDSIKEELYDAAKWSYAVWSEYSKDNVYAPIYAKKSNEYLDSLISVSKKGTHEYYYRLAEKCVANHDFANAKDNYLLALNDLPNTTRLYAQVAFALAMVYRNLGDFAECRKWLVTAAISDQVNSLKENLALQTLAMSVRYEDGDVDKAYKYLKLALEDAVAFNNRLRILEIARIIPEIIGEYQNTLEERNNALNVSLVGVTFLIICLIITIMLVIKQKRKAENSMSLLSELNAKLKSLNMSLVSTDKSREQYVSLFMALCVGYIDKLNKLQMSVVTKIESGQVDALLKMTKANMRPPESEIREMFMNFDRAFLNLYPDFIDRFNELLAPGNAIYPKKNELLNADLRLFAFIRMGLTDSVKIATLMFYSPQTVFNRRSKVRNMAKDRVNFEIELMKICSYNGDY